MADTLASRANPSPMPQGSAPGNSAMERSDDNPHTGNSTDATLLREAKDRFNHSAKWEHNARQYYLDDIKFANADAYNGYQWPNDIRRNRDVEERPCLTINKVRQHNRQIINDALQNKPAIKIRPTGNGATAESASMLNAIMRYIEYRSNATVAYDTATRFQVEAGKGWLRVTTQYVNEDSFDQEPRIMRIDDPLTVYVDPECREADKSDMRYAFIFDDVLKDEFDTQYPEFKGFAAPDNAVSADGSWVHTDFVRVCEYFRKVSEADVLYAYTDPKSGTVLTMRESILKEAPDLLKMIQDAPQTKRRDTTTERIEWHFIVGDRVVESKEWVGKYIPLVPVIGEEVVIDGVYDCKGHTRAMIDPQRMYNYWSSLAVEYGALQAKSPWIAPAEAIEGYESYWNTANRTNHSVLPFNGLDDAGNPIPAPQRVEPPVAAPVALSGMQISANELAMVSGQYQDSMGERSNERSAKAIGERQRQGDNATYHYIDNLAIAIRQVGKILLDLIPRLFDTARVMRIVAEDGIDFQLEIDPQAQAVYAKRMQHDGTVAAHVLNPAVGTYEVEADIGPSYGTKREETANALTLLLTQAPTMVPLVGDLLLRSMDFDMADEAAARLRRMVPPQALGEGPTITEQQLQAQVAQLQDLLRKTLMDTAGDKLKLRGKDERRDIDAMREVRERLKTLLDYKKQQGGEGGPPAVPGLDEMIDRTMREIIGTDATGEILRANMQDVGGNGPAAANGQGGPIQLPSKVTDVPPIPGARKGKDGHWYVRNYGASNAYSVVK
jgi:hypothetical protein